MLLIIWTTTEDFCNKEASCPILDRLKYIQILICAELALLLVIQIIYIGKYSNCSLAFCFKQTNKMLLASVCCWLTVKIVRFNRSKPPPDVEQDDVVLSHMHTTVHEQEVGFR